MYRRQPLWEWSLGKLPKQTKWLSLYKRYINLRMYTKWPCKKTYLFHIFNPLQLGSWWIFSRNFTDLQDPKLHSTNVKISFSWLKNIHPCRLTWNPRMEVWFRWFSFSIGWFLASMIIFLRVCYIPSRNVYYGYHQVSATNMYTHQWPSITLMYTHQASL